MNRRVNQLALLLTVVLGLFGPPHRTAIGQDVVLPNGIHLPQAWPPQRAALPREPQTPPYLAAPPDVIDIRQGRQLFVDDFLIDQTDLTRTYHQSRWADPNPVLKPDQPWEMATQPNPTAMVFSDGVWYDPQDKLYKMWYMGGYLAGTCYATSRDGLAWEKPVLDVVPGTNYVHKGSRDSSTVWLDHQAAKPAERFKMATYTSGALALFTSPDGIHWDARGTSGPTGDRTTVFFNPFRGRWIYSIRAGVPGIPRVRRYWEARDFVDDAHWPKLDDAVLWTGADNADPRREDLKTQPQLYNLDCTPYESLLLGLFIIWRGQPADRAKPNEICLGFSRDGFHWHRPDRRAFIPVSEKYGDWNWGNVQSAGGGLLVVGDRLRFYVSGRAGVKGSRASGICSTGLALLRRDGFASLDAGDKPGTVTTRRVRFKGGHLFVNASTAQGELRAEVLDGNGNPIAPFTRDKCRPVQSDGTCLAVTWKEADGLLERLAEKPVRLRFYLTRGSLYSFWISPDVSGASYGYVAAGGPGFTGPIDTIGAKEPPPKAKP